MADKEKDYFEMTPDETYLLIKSIIPEGSYFFEIAAGGRSLEAIERLKNEGHLNWHRGTNIDDEEVKRGKVMGLDRVLVKADHNYEPDFRSLQAQVDENAVAGTFGLAKFAPDVVKRCKDVAQKVGIKFITYPEVK